MASLIPFLFLIIIHFPSLITPLVNGRALSPSASASAYPFFETAAGTSPTVSPAASPAPSEIQKICNVTKYPDVCASTLANYTTAPALEIVKTAIASTIANTNTAIEMVAKLMNSAANNPNLTEICFNCLEGLRHSLFRLQSSINGLPTGTKDARAWLASARFCLQSFKHVNDTVEIQNLSSFLEKVNMININALSMVRCFDIFGPDTGKWAAPKTERDGFWEPFKSTVLDFPTKFPTDLKIDLTVSKGGTGFKTVQEAVDAAPLNLTDKKFVIHIKEGIYDEIVRIKSSKKNIVFIGDGIGKTIITGKLDVSSGRSTLNTSTVGVNGDGFMAKDLTFKNEAGIPSKQAVAFKSSSDRSYIENCEFVGHQDTLYSYALRQMYKSCRIEGNIDFIFGNGAAYFKDCQIFVNPRLENPEKGEKNFVTAQGREDPMESTGFVFNNCTVTGTPEYMELFESNRTKHKNFLGRPWREFARTVFINSFLDAIIAPQGWKEWKGNESLSTCYYGEFGNRGLGSDLKGRVPWSSQIPTQYVPTYSMHNFIQGDDWLPKP
ncbi:Plant invertase/pectin methylesterase inhibitor superfamily [Euphorbia peplus]|nr:Plant invertase/pectin methylesterase inhibitor superfamily [Euphorbia peplus]